jgi:hypothetical protein
VRGSVATSAMLSLPPPTDRIISPEAKVPSSAFTAPSAAVPTTGGGGVGGDEKQQQRRLGVSPRPSFDGNKPEIRIEAANQVDLDGPNHHILSLPHGLVGWIMYILGLPVSVLVYISVPDPRRAPFQSCWLITIILSMIWLFGLVFLMVWMATIISVTLTIDDSVIGLTFVAFGLTMPELWRSLKHVAMVDRAANERTELLRTRTLTATNGNSNDVGVGGIASVRAAASAGGISVAVSEANAAALVAAASSNEPNNNDNNSPMRTHTSGNSLIILPPGTVGVHVNSNPSDAHAHAHDGHINNGSHGGDGNQLPISTIIDVTALSIAAPVQPASPLPATSHVAATSVAGNFRQNTLAPVPVTGAGGITSMMGSKRNRSNGTGGGLMSKKGITTTTTNGVRRTRTSQGSLPRKSRSGRRPYDNPHLSLMLGRHIFALMVLISFSLFFFQWRAIHQSLICVCME